VDQTLRTVTKPEAASTARPAQPATRLRSGRGPPYVIFTFQKTGAMNLRTPWTFFRKAVGWTY
jgi:hypothetical protein